VFCAIVPIGFLFFVLAPARGAPVAFGMPAGTMALVVLTHIVWGVGIVVWLRALGAVPPGPRPRIGA
jgi:hypothetical protein